MEKGLEGKKQESGRRRCIIEEAAPLLWRRVAAGRETFARTDLLTLLDLKHRYETALNLKRDSPGPSRRHRSSRPKPNAWFAPGRTLCVSPWEPAKEKIEETNGGSGLEISE